MPPSTAIASNTASPAKAVIVGVALLSAALSATVVAADNDPDQTQDSVAQHAAEKQSPQRRAGDIFDHRMKPVANEAAANTPGHGWRYFSDPAARRAVVISPQGDYYFSRGKGLRWVAAEQI